MNVMGRHKLKRSRVRDNEDDKEKKHDVNFTKELWDEEIKLVQRKLEAQKARKRTGGPYRKSLVNKDDLDYLRLNVHSF